MVNLPSDNDTDRLLLVEDDRELASMIVAFLSDEGFDVEWIDDGAAAVDRLRSKPSPDLTLLDVMLPNVSGVEICRRVRDRYSNPILMLTAKDDDITEITSLNRGADGYLTKPVRPHVLLAHIKSTLRRARTSDREDATPDTGILRVQDLEICPASVSASMDGKALSLTTAEYDLLELLARNAGRMVTRETLYKDLRGIDYDGLDRSIDMRVSALRNKMGDGVPPFRYIKTVRGRGYLLALK